MLEVNPEQNLHQARFELARLLFHSGTPANATDQLSIDYMNAYSKFHVERQAPGTMCAFADELYGELYLLWSARSVRRRVAEPTEASVRMIVDSYLKSLATCELGRIGISSLPRTRTLVLASHIDMWRQHVEGRYVPMEPLGLHEIPNCDLRIIATSEVLHSADRNNLVSVASST